MGDLIDIHAENPQPRRIAMVVSILRDGGVLVYPTDSVYAIGCRIGDKAAMERIRRIRQLDKRHLFSLVCRDLSDIANHARVDNQAYRLLRSMTPGPYTFVLPATKHVPKRLQHPRRRTVGIRVPAHPITRAILDELGEPLLSSSMQMPGSDTPLADPYDIFERVGADVDLVIDGGVVGVEPTSVIALIGAAPEVIRRGIGDVAHLIEA